MIGAGVVMLAVLVALVVYLMGSGKDEPKGD
jgi:hypothetical protein